MNIILHGKPYSGKDTQITLLEGSCGFKTISIKETVRNHLKNETRLGKLMSSFIDRGELIPDEIIFQILQQEIEEKSNLEGIIFNGFPLKVSQVEALDTLLSSQGTQIHGFFMLEIDDEVLVERHTKWIEKVYVKKYGKEDIEHTFRHRLLEYTKKINPIIEFYKNQNKYYSIDGVGSIEEINIRILKKIESF